MGNKFSVKNIKFSKIFKNHLLSFFLNPVTLFNKEKRNLKFQFDLFHGYKYLSEATKLMNKDDRGDFENYNKQYSFHGYLMFPRQQDRNFVSFNWFLG